MVATLSVPEFREYVEALEREMTERDNQITLLRMNEEGNRVVRPFVSP